MAGSSLEGIILALKWIGIGILTLTGLLAVLTAVNARLRTLARHHILKTDLDLIGTTAEVTRTIRPWRCGQVRYIEAPDDLVIADAVSDMIIPKGSEVLITAISEGRLRVLPVGAGGKTGAKDG